MDHVRPALAALLAVLLAAPLSFRAPCGEPEPPKPKPKLTEEEKKEIEALEEELAQMAKQIANFKTSKPAASPADKVTDKKVAIPDVKTASHAGKLEIGGLVQVWYQHFQRDNLGLFDDPVNAVFDTNEGTDNSSFLARRAQLQFTYKPNGYVTGYMMIDAAREALTFPLVTDNKAVGGTIFKQNNIIAPEVDNNGGAPAGLGNFLVLQNLHNGLGSPARILQDAFINFHNNPECPGDFDWHHDLQVGQFLPAFGEEGLRSNAQLDFVERSHVGIMGNNRDLGIQLHGSWWCDRFQYWVGAFNGTQDYHMSNGQGNNRSDNNDSKDFSYRIMVRPLDSECWGKMELGFSSEIGRHGEAGDIDPITNPINGLNRTSTWAQRHGAWGYYAPGGWLTGLWTRGEWGWYRDRNTPGTVIDYLAQGTTDFGNTGSGSGFAQGNGKAFAVQGWYVAAGYRFRECQTPHPLPKMLKDVELAFRFQQFGNVLTADLVNPAHTDVFTTAVYTGGINYYIKEHNAKIQLNYNKVVNPDQSTVARSFHELRNDSFVVNFQVAF